MTPLPFTNYLALAAPTHFINGITEAKNVYKSHIYSV